MIYPGSRLNLKDFLVDRETLIFFFFLKTKLILPLRNEYDSEKIELCRLLLVVKKSQKSIWNEKFLLIKECSRKVCKRSFV